MLVRTIRVCLLGSVAATSMFVGVAFAQTTEGTEEVVVTGSRIVRNGNDAPIPVAVVTAEEMQNIAPEGVPQALLKLPALGASRNSQTYSGGTNGTVFGGGNFLNLNDLGPNRVLILQDGRRANPTNFDNTVDIDTLPDLLTTRVDVTTGGNSAVYGSDAVAGVVNFITDTKYDGMKGFLQGGISEYGDARSVRTGFAAGMDLFGGRGHIEASAEYYNRAMITNAWTRPYGALSVQVVGAGTAANPNFYVQNARASNVAPGGLVVGGPFSGQQFLPNGQLAAFNAGTPTPTANLAIGGDGGTQGPESLTPSIMNHQEFVRFDFDVTPSTHWFVQTSFGQVRNHSQNQNLQNTPGSYPVGIYSGNAFLTPTQQAALNAAGLTSQTSPAFLLNRYDNDIGGAINYTDQGTNFAVTTGLSGKVFGDFDWDAYYTHGQAQSSVHTMNNINTRNFYAATDAIAAPAGNALNIPTGTTICRATLVTPGLFPGCAPLDLFGDGAPSAAARAYIFQTTGFKVNNTLDDFGANVTGTLFDGWAGPVKFASGVEYRLQSLVESTFPGGSNAFDPTGLRPVLTPSATAPSGFPLGNLAFTKDIAAPAHGSESVYEGNVEVNVPLIKGVPLLQLVEFDGAYRYTQYSISGSANTWKLGLDWQVFDDLRIRASRSRDIRAPTLNDLFAGQKTSIIGFNDQVSTSGGTTNLITQGNPALKPEVAQNTTAGLVYTPHYLPGFSTSFDFFRTYIGNAIGTVSGQDNNVQNACIASGGTSPLCALFLRTSPTAFPYAVISQNANLALNYTEGYNIEVNYTFNLDDVFASLPGALSNRVFFTRQPFYKQQSIPGTVVSNAIGVRQPTQFAPALSKDRLTWDLGYQLDTLSVDMLLRYFGPIRNTGTPGVVYLNDHLAAYTQVDFNIEYGFNVDDVPLSAFVNINNAFDATGPIVPTGTSANPGLFYPAASYADVIGTYYTVGLRFKM